MALNLQTLSYLIGETIRERPRSILHFGVGVGALGAIMLDFFERDKGRTKSEWEPLQDAVLINEERNPIIDYCFNHVYRSRDPLSDLYTFNLNKYDVILIPEALPSIPKDDYRAIIDKLLKHALKCIVICCPLYSNNAGAYSYSRMDFAGYDFLYYTLPLANETVQLIKLYSPNPLRKSVPHDAWQYHSEPEKRLLKIGYIIPHKNPTNTVKSIITHMSALQNAGHKVTALYRAHGHTSALPEWANIKVERDIVVPPDKLFSNYTEGLDCIVATWFEQLNELTRADKPVILYEQGHDGLFGSHINLGGAKDASTFREYMQDSYTKKCGIIAASRCIADSLKVKFHRNAPVAHYGINLSLYENQKPARGMADNEQVILLFGNPLVESKGCDLALLALQSLWSKGYRFRVVWVTYDPAEVKGIEFPISFTTANTEQELAAITLNADILLYPARLDPMASPVLSAFASRLAVITTECGGVSDFVQPDYNAIVAPHENPEALVEALIKLLQNPALSKELGEKAHETACKFSIDTFNAKMNDALHRYISFSNVSLPK